MQALKGDVDASRIRALEEENRNLARQLAKRRERETSIPRKGKEEDFLRRLSELLADENRWEPRRVLGELRGDSGSGSGPGNIGGLRGSSTTMTATTRVSIASSASGAGTPDADNCEGIEWG